MIHGGAARIALILVVPLSLSGIQPAKGFSLPYSDRIRTSGFVEYNGRFANAQDETTIANSTTVHLNAASYIWRPWVALVDGGLGVTLSSQSNGTSHTGRVITGDGNLRLFPQSTFPFTAFFSRTNSVLEGDTVAPDLTNTRFGFNQRLKGFWIDNSRILLRYQRSISTDEESDLSTSNQAERRDVDDSLGMSASTAYEDHIFNLDSSFDRLTREDPDETNDRILQVLKHNYRRDDTLSINNLVSYNNSTFEFRNSESSFSTFQANSNAFWQPETEKRLLVTGNALFASRNTGTGGSDGVTSRNATAGAQASYQWSQYLNYRAQANMSVAQSGDANRVSTLQGLGLNYSPAAKPLLGFNYSYTLSADARNTTSPDTSLQSITTNAGHVFSKSLLLIGGVVNFSASQRAATALDSTGALNRTFTHTFISGWNRTTEKSSAFMRMTLSDTRRSGEDEDGLQLANFQASYSQQVSRNVRWNGNASFQVSRPLSDDDDTVDMNSSIDFSYNHSRLFGVRRLNFASEFRYLTNSLLNIVRSDRLDTPERDQSFWRNRLSYLVGRLSVGLNANMGMTNGELNSSLFLQVRRQFGN